MNYAPNKFIQPIINERYEMDELRELSAEEKINRIKIKYNLFHGKGKRKKRRNSKI